MSVFSWSNPRLSLVADFFDGAIVGWEGRRRQGDGGRPLPPLQVLMHVLVHGDDRNLKLVPDVLRDTECDVDPPPVRARLDLSLSLRPPGVGKALPAMHEDPQMLRGWEDRRPLDRRPLAHFTPILAW